MRLTKPCLVILLVFVFELCMSCAPAVWQKVDLAKRQGKLEDAATALELHLKQNPKDARAHYQLGEMYAQQGQWRLADRQFRTCDSLDDRWQRETSAARDFYWTENVNRGLAHLDSDQILQATTNFENATYIQTERSVAHRLLGETQFAMNDMAAARRAFEAALQLDEDDERARRYLMTICFQTADYQCAVTTAGHLQSVFPGDEEALRTIAYSHDRLGAETDAAQAYQELCAVSQTAADFQAFAAFRFKQGAFEDAVRLSREAIDRGGSKVDNLRAIAQIQLMHQDFEALRKTARAILEEDPSNLAALQLLQVSEAALMNPEELEAVSARIRQLEK